MIVCDDTGAAWKLEGRCVGLVGLILAHQDRIDTLTVGRVVFHVRGRRVVLELAEAAVASTLAPKGDAT